MRKLLTLLPLIVALAGCGFKGNLYLPENAQQSQPEADGQKQGQRK